MESVPKLGGTISPIHVLLHKYNTIRKASVFTDLHCNYLPLVIWHETFTTSPLGSGVAWPALYCSEPSVKMKWSSLQAPCGIQQNSDHKWPTWESILDMLPDTIWLLETEQCLDPESLCNLLKKQISVSGHCGERYIACCLAEGWFQIW